MYAALDEIEDNFNSHTREGVTQSLVYIMQQIIFQLTHP